MRKVILISVILLLMVLTQTNAMVLSQAEYAALQVLGPSAAPAFQAMFERARANPSEAPEYGVSGEINPLIEVGAISGALGAVDMTLADGTPGSLMILVCSDATNPVTITPAHTEGFTKIFFHRAGDGVVIAFDGTSWYLVAMSGETTITGGKSEVNTQDDNGAIDLTTDVTLLDASGKSLTMTLADGNAGQRKKVVLVDDANTATITPDNPSGFNKIVLTQEGDSADFLFDGTNWVLMSLKAYTSTAEITTEDETAIPTNVGTVVLTSGGKHELSLADGDYTGQKINIICIDQSTGLLFLPSSSFSGPSYITTFLEWNTDMDSCILMWDGTYWQLIANNGVGVS